MAMPVLRMPSPLRPYVNGQAEVPVAGVNVAEAMESLMDQFPTLRPHLANSSGELRPFVNLFLSGTNVRDLQGLQTPLGEDDRLLFVLAVAGG